MVYSTRALREIFNRVARAVERYGQRKYLRPLDERMLKDIGLSRADVDREYGRPLKPP